MQGGNKYSVTDKMMHEQHVTHDLFEFGTPQLRLAMLHN